MTTAFQTLCQGLGAVYLQDPLDPAGYTLSGSDVTHVVNLIDSAQIAKGGTGLLRLATICGQASFAYNSAAAGSVNTHIRRTAYAAVTSCLQTDFTLFFTADPTASGTQTVLSCYSTQAVDPTTLRVLIARSVSPSNLTLTLEKRKTSGPSYVVQTAATVSTTHHVYEITCTNTAWAMFVDGTAVGSGTWSNSGTAWQSALVNFQMGAYGHTATPDSYSVTREHGQAVLFPSVLSSGDRATVRAAMLAIMCGGHPRPLTGSDSLALADSGALELIQDDENPCHHAA